jgi:hypothetical protein
MGKSSFDISDLLWANGFDAGTTASITAIAAPGVGFKIVIVQYKLNVLTADTVAILSNVTEKDRHYLGAASGIYPDFNYCPLELNANEPFIITKTLGTTVSWSCQYQVVKV